MASAKAEAVSSAPSLGAPGWLGRTWLGKSWGERLERAALGLLGVLFLLGLVVRSDALPMHIWDESRNANNALEAVRSGNWLAPTYNGAADHWNTKPPLLIWLIASGLSLGLPPLWALRLPSLLAAAATLSLIWTAIRLGLRDRLAALIAVALVLSSALYMGIHGARTGDFDCLETLFITGYVLSFWKLLRAPARTIWFAAFAGSIVGAVLTKGIAGLLPTPGLLLCLIANRTRALQLVRDWRSWVGCGSAVLAGLAYYAVREHYDHGYIAAVLANEVGGRFAVAQDGRTGGDLLFYVRNSVGLEPAVLLLPLGLFALRARDEARELAIVALVAGASLFLVISSAQTKLTWYALPLVPLLSLPSALGASQALRRVQARNSRPMRIAAAAACVCLVVILPAGQAMRSFSLPDHYRPGHPRPLGADQILYGRAIAALRREGFTRPVAIVDSGFPNGPAGASAYNPIVDFYLTWNAGSHQFRRVRPPQPLAPGSTVLTCDPKSLAWLEATYAASAPASVEGCSLATVAGSAPSPLAGEGKPAMPAPAKRAKAHGGG